jgi:hypothetical protein
MRATTLSTRRAMLAIALIVSACKAGTEDSATGGSGGGMFAGSGSNGTGGEGASCALYQHTEVHKPVNLYIMFDKSSSMAGTKWDSSKTGLSAYVENPGSDNIQAALRFFPRAPDQTPACDQKAYQTPTVPYGPLPANAPAIEAAMNAEAPNGFDTPMYPALGGAILEGIQMAANNPGQASAVLLVTDGLPVGPSTNCNGVDPEDPQVVAGLASTGLAMGVSTFVVGLPGVDQAKANLIAAAGGTGSAILVGTTNVAVEFQNALSKVAGEAIPCDYDVPAEVISGEIELGKVNVEITPSSGDPYTLPYDQDCSSGGWKYDDPTAPTSIEICPSACNTIKADNGGSIRVVLGCNAIVK